MKTETTQTVRAESLATNGDMWLYQRLCHMIGISLFPWFIVLYLATAASGSQPTSASMTFGQLIMMFPLLAIVCGLCGKLFRLLGKTKPALIVVGIAAYAGMSICVLPVVAIPVGLSLEQSTSLRNIVVLTVFLTLSLSALVIYATCRYSKLLSAHRKVPSEALTQRVRDAATSP